MFRTNVLNSGNLLELIVNFLFKDQEIVIQIVDSDVVGPLDIVLDKADYATASFVPSVTVARTLAVKNLKDVSCQALKS